MISREEILHQRTTAYGVRIRPETVTAWSFLLPTLLLLMVLAVYPLGYAFFLSMTDAQVSGPAHFVGLQNFGRLLRTAIFTLTLSNTIWYTLGAVAAKLVLGLVLALVLPQRVRGMRGVRGAGLIPWVGPTSLARVARRIPPRSWPRWRTSWGWRPATWAMRRPSHSTSSRSWPSPPTYRCG